MNKHVVTAIKLVFVAALLAWVSSNVPWSDRYVTIDLATEEETVQAGTIEGRWDVEPVRFRIAGATTVVELQNGPAVRIEPGFWTYVRNLKWGWFLLGALCYILSTTFAATRWWWLLRVNQLKITFWAL